ncbi:hypothetical protein LY78DRAFT_749151, partial [Colletotrichum sublineola]
QPTAAVNVVSRRAGQGCREAGSSGPGPKRSLQRLQVQTGRQAGRQAVSQLTSLPPFPLLLQPFLLPPCFASCFASSKKLSKPIVSSLSIIEPEAPTAFFFLLFVLSPTLLSAAVRRIRLRIPSTSLSASSLPHRIGTYSSTSPLRPAALRLFFTS